MYGGIELHLLANVLPEAMNLVLYIQIIILKFIRFQKNISFENDFTLFNFVDGFQRIVPHVV